MDVDEFLSHHGVKGMKWGVINKDDPATQPTTKQESKTAARNANAQKYVDKANDAQRKIDELLASPGTTSFQRARIHKQVTELKQVKKQALVDADKKRQGKLSTNQKKVAIGAAVVAGTLLAVGAYNMGQSGELTQNIQRGKAFVTGKGPWKERPGLARTDLTPDQLQFFVAKKVNPGYGLPGTKVNCRRCTFAYEMRRRGYDVAATKTTNGSGQTVAGLYNALSTSGDIVEGRRGILTRTLKEEYKTQIDPKAASPFKDLVEMSSGGLGLNPISRNIKNGGSIEYDVFDALRTQPSGARGELGMTWVGGGAHSIAWEIVKGEPVIFDTQSGKMFKSPSEFVELAHGIKDAAFTRLDNMPLNTDFLQRWVTSA